MHMLERIVWTHYNLSALVRSRRTFNLNATAMPTLNQISRSSLDSDMSLARIG